MQDRRKKNSARSAENEEEKTRPRDTKNPHQQLKKKNNLQKVAQKEGDRRGEKGSGIAYTRTIQDESIARRKPCKKRGNLNDPSKK